MSIFEKFAIRTLLGGIILNMIIYTHYTPPNLFNYFYSYFQSINENIFSKEIVEILFSLSNIVYLLFIPLGIILYLNYNLNTNTISGISLILIIISNYLLTKSYTNQILILLLIIKSSGSGLCFLPILLEIWKYYPNMKGLITGIFFIGKGIAESFYEYISIKIINPKEEKMNQNENMYPPNINDKFLNYLRTVFIFLCGISIICQFLIYPYSIYGHHFYQNQSEFKEKMQSGIIQDFYILASPKNYGNKPRNNKNKEPIFSLIVSCPFLQFICIYFLIMTFNSLDLTSIQRLGLLMNIENNFISFSNKVWKFTNVFWSIISGFLLDNIKFKKFFMHLLLTLIFLISTSYFILHLKFGYLLFNIISSVIDSINNIFVPISFSIVYGNETGLLLYGISLIMINSFLIYRDFIRQILNEKIYYFVFCFICTIFYMFALITLCLFEQKKHIYKRKDEEIDQNSSNDLSYGQELSDINLCNPKEFNEYKQEK